MDYHTDHHAADCIPEPFFGIVYPCIPPRYCQGGSGPKQADLRAQRILFNVQYSGIIDERKRHSGGTDHDRDDTTQDTGRLELPAEVFWNQEERWGNIFLRHYR